MQITKITARRVVHKSIGQYEFDERIFEYEADLAPGEDVRAGTAKLNELLQTCFRSAPEPVVEHPNTVVKDTPLQCGADPDEAQCYREVVPVIAETPIVETPMSLQDFMAELASLAKAKGADGILKAREKYGIAKVADLAPELRAEFLQALS